MTPLDLIPPSSLYQVRAAREDEVEPLIWLGAASVPTMKVDIDAIWRVYEHNPDTLLVIVRDGKVCGGVGLLYLNTEDLEALMWGEWNPARPHPTWLCTRWEKPRGIYVWAMKLPHPRAFGNIMAFLRAPGLADVPLYARGGTDAGLRFMLQGGMVPVGMNELYTYKRVTPPKRGYAVGQAERLPAREYYPHMEDIE